MTKRAPVDLPSKKCRGGGETAPREAGIPERAFTKLSELAFEEWNGAEDEAAFRNL